MKRSAIAVTALLALCVLALAGCTGYENEYRYRHFGLKPADVERQEDGTRLVVSATSSEYHDDEKRQIRSGAPFHIEFSVKGRFERVDKIDAWLVLNGREIPIPLNREFDDAGNIPLRSYDGEMSVTGKPQYILETPWKSIRTLELHTRITATVDGVTREYHIVTPFEKNSSRGTARIYY